MDKFCENCGTPLNEQGACPNCGHQNAPVQPQEVYEPKVIDEAKIASRKKKMKIAKIVISIICAISIIFSSCVALVYYDVVDIPPINAILEGLDMIEEEPEDKKSDEKTDNITSDNKDDESEGNKEYLTNFKCDTFDIYVDDDKTVLFTVEVTDEDAVDTDKLSVYDEDDDIVVRMYDDGKNGDRTKDDNIYSARTELYSDEIKVVKYYASDKKVKSNQFSVNFYENIDRESYESMKTLAESLEGLSYEEALEIIKNSSEVKSFFEQEDAGVITYKTIYGFTGIYEDPDKVEPGMKAGGAKASTKKAQITSDDYEDAGKKIEKIDLDRMNGLDPDVIVLRPFRESQFTYDDFEYAGELVSEATDGYLTVVDEDDADIRRFRSLSGYGTVLIDSHGAWMNGSTPYIVTGEVFNEYRDYSADYHSDRIVVLGGGRLAINSEFFNRYYSDNALNSSFWFLGTCHSLQNESIANALVSKGAGAVTGFTESVSVTYCNQVLYESVINSMVVSADSVKEGVESSREVYGDRDHGNSGCKYVFEGDSSYVMFNNNVNETSSERDIVLVLDRSGSMAGTPINETKIAAKKFVESILGKEASIGIVTYESNAKIVTYTTDNNYALINSIDSISTAGSTNAGAGLKLAEEMLKDSKAKKKIIVLMSDGVPNEGLVGDDLIEYANEIKNDGVYIYTLGFFEALDSKYEPQRIMRGIASEGCHYEVADASQLVYFFEDMADQINGQQYYHIRIACPVDVTVKYKGETLCSSEDNLNTRTSFGTITFEQAKAQSDNSYDEYVEPGVASKYGDSSMHEYDSEEEEDDLVKILRLKEGVNYDISIEGTGTGTMDYTISFMDEDGEYTDQRKFKNIVITRHTEIDTVAARLSKTTLNVDQDGDGEYDLVYKAGKNEKGELVDNTGKLLAIFLSGGISALVLTLIIVFSIRKRKKEKMIAA